MSTCLLTHFRSKVQPHLFIEKSQHIWVSLTSPLRLPICDGGRHNRSRKAARRWPRTSLVLTVQLYRTRLETAAILYSTRSSQL